MQEIEVTKLCKEKEQELLNKYFGNLVKEAAIECPETIEEYTKDLPLNIEAEYYTFLEKLWKEYAPEELKNTPLVLERAKASQTYDRQRPEKCRRGLQRCYNCKSMGKDY